MGSLADLHSRAHPNSILLRKHPHGAALPDLPHYTDARTDKDARVNTGFPDDYTTPTDHHAQWDIPSLTDRDAA